MKNLLKSQAEADKLILYSFRRCPFAIRVRMVLEEKNLPYELIEENLKQLSPQLKSLHPEARVPLLVHHLHGKQHVIYQSTIITEYLDDMYRDVPLMTEDAVERMEIRLWTYWCDQIFKKDLDVFKYKKSELSESERESLYARLHSYFTKWDDALRNKDFLLANRLTLADIHLFPFARQFLAIKDLAGFEKYTNIQRWLASLCSRPSFARAMQIKET